MTTTLKTVAILGAVTAAMATPALSRASTYIGLRIGGLSIGFRTGHDHYRRVRDFYVPVRDCDRDWRWRRDRDRDREPERFSGRDWRHDHRRQERD